jgi:organic radical activating enzyme
MYIRGNKEVGYRILKWKITNKCNYACPYCFQQHSSYQIDDYEYIIQRLNHDIPKMNIFTVPRLIGGEPTCHTNFNQICNLFTIPFGVYTNLSMSYDELYQLLQNKYLHHIYCSYHAFKQDKDFIRKIKLINSFNVINYVAVMLENSELEPIITECKSIVNGYVICKVIEDYNVSIKLEQYAQYLIPQQEINIDGVIYTRLGGIPNCNLRNAICDINKYQIELTEGYKVKRCLLNNNTVDVTSIPEKQVCRCSSCHIFTYEFGIKERK